MEPRFIQINFANLVTINLMWIIPAAILYLALHFFGRGKAAPAAPAES